MERARLLAYEVTLTQAKHTPCMKSPLQEQSGSCGEILGTHLILEGKEYDIEGTDEATREVLKYVQLKEGTQLIYTPLPILVQEGQSGWAKAKKKHHRQC